MRILVFAKPGNHDGVTDLRLLAGKLERGDIVRVQEDGRDFGRIPEQGYPDGFDPTVPWWRVIEIPGETRDIPQFTSRQSEAKGRIARVRVNYIDLDQLEADAEARLGRRLAVGEKLRGVTRDDIVTTYKRQKSDIPDPGQGG